MKQIRARNWPKSSCGRIPSAWIHVHTFSDVIILCTYEYTRMYTVICDRECHLRVCVCVFPELHHTIVHVRESEHDEERHERCQERYTGGLFHAACARALRGLGDQFAVPAHTGVGASQLPRACSVFESYMARIGFDHVSSTINNRARSIVIHALVISINWIRIHLGPCREFAGSCGGEGEGPYNAIVSASFVARIVCGVVLYSNCVWCCVVFELCVVLCCIRTVCGVVLYSNCAWCCVVFELCVVLCCIRIVRDAAGGTHVWEFGDSSYLMSGIMRSRQMTPARRVLQQDMHH